MTFKDLLERAAIKLLSLKTLFAGAVLYVIATVPLSDNNTDALETLCYCVLGAKAVQYGLQAAATIKGKKSEEGQA